MTHLFSVHDALQVAKAVVLAESLICLVLFSATRLEGIPRSTPFIHALILAAGLVLCRALVRALRREQDAETPAGDVEHVIIIGSNRLSSLYIGFLRAYGHCQINGVLDDRPEMLGRSVAGVKVLGPIAHLKPLMEEFLDHGIQIDRVLVGTDADALDEQQREHLDATCAEHQIALQYIPELVGLSRVSANPSPARAAAAAETAAVYTPLSRYFRLKRYIDFAISFALLIALWPLFALAAGLVMLDMGTPVFFWQRRLGMHGRAFQLHKFRTLKPSFDQKGLPIPSVERISLIGGFLRKTRLDELPQLLNVLVGDMSLIGPRPLLTEDQPADPRVRLSVRPGITGWAQVNGGKTIDAETKNQLDEWYVRHASLWVDFKIVLLTIVVMLKGEAAQVDPASLSPARPPASPEQPRVHAAAE